MTDYQSDIKVSICMLAYNQESVIAEAIEGVVMQKTNFRIELIIGEDCSTDNTRHICLRYQEKYPEVIKLLLPKENQGIAKNSVDTLAQCTGQYIALCEGDDYWIDPYKLQKQVDFMDANEDFALVYHKVNLLNNATKEITPEKFNVGNTEAEFTISDLARGNILHTPSVLIRNKNIDFSKLQESKFVGDYFLWMLATNNGKVKFLPDVMAVYRINAGSTWGVDFSSSKILGWIDLLLILLKEFEGREDIIPQLSHQLNFNYREYFHNITEKSDKDHLDQLTKTLLKLPHFRDWWFSYMKHIKQNSLYRLKYYFYLVGEGTCPSLRLLKKCIL